MIDEVTVNFLWLSYFLAAGVTGGRVVWCRYCSRRTGLQPALDESDRWRSALGRLKRSLLQSVRQTGSLRGEIWAEELETRTRNISRGKKLGFEDGFYEGWRV